MDKPIHVLYSPSTKRVIWEAGGGITMTSSIENGAISSSVHSAGITPKEMSEYFSNAKINDWEQRIINKWSDLEEQ